MNNSFFYIINQSYHILGRNDKGNDELKDCDDLWKGSGRNGAIQEIGD
ncbi:MAG: hypothetical protein Q8908_09085 [Bacteroidota bacterium]|nr:hypothetical protein [Bacteroidota bacterium]